MSSSPSPAAAATAGATGSLAPLTGRRCFNAHCKRQIAGSPPPRFRGWRLRSGELAELCDRCSAAYEQESFCETFHSDSDGWRKCGSCGKRVHCGCIVSVATFMLLDAGGIECISCAQKSFATAPKHVQQFSLLFPLGPDRVKGFSTKNWSQLTASHQVSGNWHHAPYMLNSRSEVQQRFSYEFDRPNGTDRFISARGFATSSQDKIKFDGLPERVTPQMNHSQLGKLFNGNSTVGAPVAAHQLIREEGIDVLENSLDRAGEAKNLATRKEHVSSLSINSDAGIDRDIHPVSTVNMPIITYLRNNPSATSHGLAAPLPLLSEKHESTRVSSSRPYQQRHASLLAKDVFSDCHNSAESGGQPQNQVHNGKPRAEGQGRNQLLPRYWPRITDQELQQISGDSNSVITPLFEKILSASDAGRIGRLVLPKKCAERASFSIGSGVSTQQIRLDFIFDKASEPIKAYFPSISQPEGLPIKIQDVKGQEWAFQFRFWPNNNSRMYVLEGVTPCIQSMKLQAGDVVTFSRIDPGGKLVMGFRKTSNIPTDQDIHGNKSENGYSDGKEVNNMHGKACEGTSAPCISSLRNNSESANASIPLDQGTRSKSGRSGIIQKEATPSRYSMLPIKRKSSTLGTKSKHLWMENEGSIELNLSWEEAQELLYPPPNYKPSVMIIEGHEIEEYEEAPVLWNPTIFAANQDGASCSPAQGVSAQQLEDLLRRDQASSGERSGLGAGSDPAAASEGEGGSPPAASCKHSARLPRRRHGCTCIVRGQPPRGRGPRHGPACQCGTGGRHVQALARRREERRRQEDGEAGRTPPSPPRPAKAEIDLNTQPERDDDTATH